MYNIYQLGGKINNLEKYFTDYRLINRNNVEISNLIENVKVSKDFTLYNDYIRLYIIYQNGGLVFDGKFDIVSDIDVLLKNDMFIGYDSESTISTNIIWAKDKCNSFIKKILDFIEELNVKNDTSLDITGVFSKVLKKDLKSKINSLVKIQDNSFIYPYDYFYPIDFENHGKSFSENTKVLYYDFYKKISLKNKIKLHIFKKYGNLSYLYIQNVINSVKYKVSSKIYSIKQKIGLEKKRSVKSLGKAFNILSAMKKDSIDYIIFHNPNWLGVTSATKELFKNLVPIEEIYDRKNSKKLAELINYLGIKQVIFSAFADGWEYLAEDLKKINSNIKIKVFWHGSNSQVIDTINWRTNVKALEFHKKGIIDVFATCKESIVDFYKAMGYKTTLIKNTVILDEKLKSDILSNKKCYFSKKNKEDKIQIGIYSANMAWRKNMFNQIAAASLINNSKICSLPLNFDGQVFSSKLNEEIVGETKGVKRESLLYKMAENDINLYVTFSECAPMLPIESMEVGTLCISGNNHHYFKGTELEKYLVVDREDDVIEISRKIIYALENKEKIFKLYTSWKKKYDIESRKSVETFLEM